MNTTGSIYLKKFSSDDFNRYFSLVNNKKVMAMITERAVPEEEARRDYDLVLEKNTLHKTLGTYQIIDRANDSFIGLAKMEITEPDAREAELGYILLPEYWGKGFGSNAAEILMGIARKESQLEKVTAIIDPGNIPSRKILMRQGFTSVKVGEMEGLPAEFLQVIL